MIDDNKIIIQVLSGNKNHFSFLMEKYHNEIFAYVYNMTGSYQVTEDLLQEIFLKVYKGLSKYDKEKASFRTWLYRISSNHTVNYLKSKTHRMEQLTYEYDDSIVSSNEDIEEKTIKEEQISMIVKAINNVLKPKHQKIMYLHYFSNLSVNEISDVMEIPTKTIYKALKSSVDKIRNEVNIDE